MNTHTPKLGTTCREGTSGPIADAAHIYQAADGTTAAAIVDGIGHSPPTVHYAPIGAEVAARIAASRGGLAGLLTAAALIADPGIGPDPGPDAVAAIAVTDPRGDTQVTWVGDCRAYGWDGAELRQYTTDHTVAQQLSASGVGPLIAGPYSAWVRTSLAHATVATAQEVVIPLSESQLVLLTTDGVHDQVPHTVMEALVRTHDTDPQALADALVAAAEGDQAGVRDDATAVVMRVRQTAPPLV